MSVVSWPTDWPVYKQSCFGSFDDRCDMLVGPCACGASHQPGEFELRTDGLYRYDKKVDGRDTSNSDDDTPLEESSSWLDRFTHLTDDVTGVELFKIHELSFELEPCQDGLKLWICHPDQPPVPVRIMKTRGDIRQLFRVMGAELNA